MVGVGLDLVEQGQGLIGLVVGEIAHRSVILGFVFE
jgi:hypothetical protein